MTIERLNELKDQTYACFAGDDMFDLLRLIDAEIRKIESRRKVPLVPCRCGAKRIEQWHRRESYKPVITYECSNCTRRGGAGRTDREARIAWNEAQKGGEQ